MDASEMRELLQGYLEELDWSGGVSKAALVAKLDGRDDALRTLVGEYVPEQTYRSPAEVMNLIPTQAWEDVQGDAYRGADTFDVPATPSHFQEGAVGQDASDVHHQEEASPQTPGVGQSVGAQGGAPGAAASGETASDGGAAEGGTAGTPGAVAGASDGGTAGSATPAAATVGEQTADVDVMVVGVDVTGDGVPDAVIVDAVVIDEPETGSGGR
jgi:hypothetical protein